MSNVSSYTAIISGIGSAQAEAMEPILRERHRGFASDAETWAELKAVLERIKSKASQAESQQKDMWSAVKERNRDAFEILLEAFEENARDIAGEWVRAAAMAKIAAENMNAPMEV